MGLKTCSKCKEAKPYSEFNKSKVMKDGYQNQCNTCRREYRKANKDKIKSYAKAYRESNKDKIKDSRKAYYESNKNKVKAHTKAWREANKDKRNAYEIQRRKTDPLYKIKGNLRTRTHDAFRRNGYSKNTKTQEMLGVDWEIAKTHIERQFKKGMSWNNYGEWHIDHIIPLASATTEEKLKKLCHYTNLQPLWAEENLSKKDSVEGQQTMLRI